MGAIKTKATSVKNSNPQLFIFLGKTNQGRMDDFFKSSKVVSTTKMTPKRKAGKQGKGTPAKKQKKK